MTTSDQNLLLAPPRGYASWLDYAVATMDVRLAQQEASGLTDETSDGEVPSYEAMREAARAELEALRRRPVPAEAAKSISVLQYRSTDADNCRVYYQFGNDLVAYQRTARDVFTLYCCTKAGEPLSSMDARPINSAPENYAEFAAWARTNDLVEPNAETAAAMEESRSMARARFSVGG